MKSLPTVLLVAWLLSTEVFAQSGHYLFAYFKNNGEDGLHLAWSTTIPGKFPETAGSAGKGRNHRIYYVTTKDFKSYSKAAVFYDGGFNVIDATIADLGGKFMMLLKDETEFPAAKKHLRLTSSTKVTGPYGATSPAFTKDWVEGPTALKVNGEWIVYYDEYRDHKYGALRTRDWQKWEDVSSQLEFPKGMRHGTAFAISAAQAERLQIKWKNALRQKPDWYGGPDARRIADNLLRWQLPSGGWPKNIDMAVVLSQGEAAQIGKRAGEADATIDNGATWTQMTYLARVFNASQETQYRDSFFKGLDYLFAAQYANGGWPQFYPLIKGYYTHITYNDDAMIGVLSLLRDIAQKKQPFGFVDEAHRSKAERAVALGIECILKTQVVVDGKRTAWCAQHDEITLQPAPARTYEKISLSGMESVGIVQFLMTIEQPDARIIEAVSAAAEWLTQVKLTGIKVIPRPDPSTPRGFDRIVLEDANAAPLWARFYEIGTNRPIFCGRDGVIKANLADIEYERRTGYEWYTDRPAALLAKEYPAWRAKWRKKS